MNRLNKRRNLVIALGASVVALPLRSIGQHQGKVWRVGYLSQRARPDSLESGVFGAFRRGMQDLGYVEGKNLEIEWRFADSRFQQLPDLAAELVRLRVDAIVSVGTAATGAAQKATATIPIVIATAPDPVGSGFVASLARPGGNITGLSNLATDISPKHLEMLLGLVPGLSRVAILVNHANQSHVVTVKNVQAAAQKTNVKILPVEARTVAEIEKAFAGMVREKAGAVIVARDGLFTQQARQIAELAAKNRLPTIAGSREFVEAGGLISYGQNNADNYRRAAIFVDKIFKGAKPRDLPVEQPTKFEFVINRKTAKALGLTIPQSLLIRADEVIE
jgi:putative ABC transport system substrate-binding protein